MLRCKRLFGFMAVFLLCTTAVPAHGFFFRGLFGGMRARRIARRNRRFINNNPFFNNGNFFLPNNNQLFFNNGNGVLCNNGVSSFNNFGLHGNFSRFGGANIFNPALAAGLGGFGHCVQSGLDAGFPLGGGLGNGAFDPTGLGGGGAAARCQKWRQEPCSGGPQWACNYTPGAGQTIEAAGAGNCAQNELHFRTCVAGINWDNVNGGNTACWVPANVSGTPEGVWNKAPIIKGQVLLVLSNDYAAENVKGWIRSKHPEVGDSLLFQRSAKANVLLVSVPEGQEQTFCTAAHGWNPKAVASCAPNVFQGPAWGPGGAGAGGGGYAATGGGGGGGGAYTY